MSRIGREPITIPAGVTVTINGNKITVKGKLGELTKEFNPHMTYKQEGDKLTVVRPNDSIEMRMNHGTTRALLHNMIVGVSEGYKKVLEIRGVGYRCSMEGTDLVLYVGHSHPDKIHPFAGAKISVDGKTMQITVEGIDKQIVGQQAAVIREIKKPECYHGKGIRYVNENIVLRQPASAKKSA